MRTPSAPYWGLKVSAGESLNLNLTGKEDRGIPAACHEATRWSRRCPCGVHVTRPLHRFVTVLLYVYSTLKSEITGSLDCADWKRRSRWSACASAAPGRRRT